ncbi:hypothetical protein DXG01_012607 [Tephrocybe rancida]|nr:hypothetical protein DXG01_012607 [Tephrocybe rancida]
MSTSSSNETMSSAAMSAAGSPVLHGIFYFFVAASTVFLISYLYWVVRIRKSPTEYYVNWYLGGLGHEKSEKWLVNCKGPSSRFNSFRHRDPLGRDPHM